MDTCQIVRILTTRSTRGPENDQVLISVVSGLGADVVRDFLRSFRDAVSQLLEDTAPNLEREIGLECAAHVLVGLLQKELVSAADVALTKTCQEWLSDERRRGTLESWHAYASTLRILRVLGYTNIEFWRREFDFWVQQLIEQPGKFVEITRSLMQAVRALGKQGALNSRDLGKMFSYGLRGKHFPVHELYAALEEICAHEVLRDSTVKQALYRNVLREAQDASSPDILVQEIQRKNVSQMEKTLQSWVKNCLDLDTPVHTIRVLQHAPKRRAVIASSYDFFQAAA